MWVFCPPLSICKISVQNTLYKNTLSRAKTGDVRQIQFGHPVFCACGAPVFIRGYGIDKKGGSMTDNNFEQQLLLKANRHDSKVRCSFQFSVLTAQYVFGLIFVLTTYISDKYV